MTFSISTSPATSEGCSPDLLNGSIADVRSMSLNKTTADAAARVNSIEYGASMVIWTEPMATDKSTLEDQPVPAMGEAPTYVKI